MQNSNWQDIEKVILAASPPRIRRKFVIAKKRSFKLIRDYASAYLSINRPDTDLLISLALKSAQNRSEKSDLDPSYIAKIQTILPHMSEADCATMRYEASQTTIRKKLLQTTMMRWPDWKPNIEITGNSLAGIAKEIERPVIYWCDHTVFAELIARMAMKQISIRAMHYSDHVHEHGGVWIQRKLLQKPILKLEQRFMDERIMSFPKTHFASMRRFANAMRANRAMFSMNNAFLGRRHACTPIGNDYYLIQATAPLNMARRYNALIVPLTAIELDPFKHYRVEFHPAIEADRQLDHDDDIKRMAHLSTQRQITSIREAPEQWLCFVGDQIDTPEDRRISRYGM